MSTRAQVLGGHVQDTEELKALVKGIDEAEGMLLHHIVQGRAKQGEDGETRPRFEVTLTDPQRKAMRKDEEIVPLTEKSAAEPLVVNSGNVCQRPS
ncbi:unnamed protein product [Hyaloperonospora brassicae]|uniref:Uncharacterized protein n=1 Tax=Hyaloperonospora brassicae TaxID=162125 RepID=A0AAV0TVY0_HYABA|nr:unnamed protein product [Hyaloperonospora brassicae]